MIVLSQAYFSGGGNTEKKVVYQYPPNQSTQDINRSGLVEFSKIFESPEELLDESFKIEAEVEKEGNDTRLVSGQNQIAVNGCQDLETGEKAVLSVNLTRTITCDCEYLDPQGIWVNTTDRTMTQQTCRNAPPDLYNTGRCINNTRIANYKLQCLDKIQ